MSVLMKKRTVLFRELVLDLISQENLQSSWVEIYGVKVSMVRVPSLFLP